MPMPHTGSSKNTPLDCRIVEVLQFTCQLEQGTSGDSQIHCFPVPRFFRLCPNRPVEEITKFVNVDLVTGEVELPTNESRVGPTGRPWKKILRYEHHDK
ncbi:hypothetical protein BDN72DRAFT_842848 [Pluteus cervinus]|uniref:Uncharacterized protein n=1 Tax=Pluteus cervinus TaxID=181527 RepID=A0ACD3APY3_9AGAR|nr:hypothetical protein BDN72DRAFT_842848 [Pluteus cervinus]